MLNQTFYDDELNGKYKNLAAASDILRLEILVKEGGIYIDAKDIFPNQPLNNPLSAPYGFYFHFTDNNVNNDILASVPNGTVINAYRNAVRENYQKLYSDSQRLAAHRNAEYSSPIFYLGANARKISTLQTSGPAALDNVILAITTNLTSISEAQIKCVDESNFYFPTQSFKVPEYGQKLSWFDPGANTKYGSVIPVLRNYLREYFNQIINSRLKELNELIQAETQKIYFMRNTNIEIYKNVYSQLISLRRKLNALPTSHSPDGQETNITMENIYQLCITDLSQSDISQLNQYSHNIITRLKNCSISLEKLITYCQDAIPPEKLAISLEEMAPRRDPNWIQFISDVIDTKDGKPDLNKFEEYLQKVDDILKIWQRGK